MKSTARIGLLVVATVLALGLAANAQAQDVSGTLVGDTGGAFETMSVDAPAGADVTLTVNHWPCNTGGAVAVEVWGPSGMVAHSSEKDACTETVSFNTGDGGMHEIKLHNYLHGTPVYWTATAEGLDLGGEEAAAAEETATDETATDESMASDESMTDESMTDESMTDESMSDESMGDESMTDEDMSDESMSDESMSDEEMSADEGTTAADETAAAGSVSTSGNLLGDTGGAFGAYDMAVTEGQTYTVKMTAGTEPGGNWNGIGFDVWGPNGKVTSGTMTSHNVYEATFTADGDVVYLIQPYNYHHGLMMWYQLDGSAAQ